MINIEGLKPLIIERLKPLKPDKIMSYMIVDNRLEENIVDVKDKIYTRDVFGSDK